MKKTIYYFVLVVVTMMTSFVFTSCDKDDGKLQVTPMDLSLGAAKGESESFRITSNTMWTITGEADWLSISARSGAGDTEIHVETLSANKTERDRSVTLIVQGEKLSQTVKVTQMAGAKRLYVSMSNPVILSDGFFTELAFEGDIKGFYYECYFADQVRAYTDEAFISALKMGTPYSPQNYKYADYILPRANTNYVFVVAAYNSQYEFGPLLKYEFTSKPSNLGYDAYVGNFKKESKRWTFDIVKEVYCDSYYTYYLLDDSNHDHATTYAYYYMQGYLSSAFYASLIDDAIRANSIEAAREGGSLQMSRRNGQNAILYWTWGQNANKVMSGKLHFAYCGNSAAAPQVNRQPKRAGANGSDSDERVNNKPTSQEIKDMKNHVKIADQ